MLKSLKFRDFYFVLFLISTSILVLETPVQGNAQEFIASNKDGVCPAGYKLATPQLARSKVQKACGVLGTWYIARLAGGGSMDGRGYQCKIRDKDTRGLGNSLCSKGAEVKYSSKFPHDVTNQVTAFPKVSFNDLAEFAWQEFVALNFPADPNHRGKPLAGSKLTDVADARVWETYWHRVEVFPYDEKPAQSGGKAIVNAKPKYIYSPNAFALDKTHFDASSTGKMNNQLWNNLDEDSELNVDEMFGRAKSTSDFTNENRILYEAKMNEDAFNYILANKLEKETTRKPILAAGKAGLKAYGSTCGKAPADQVSLVCGSNAGAEGHVEIKAAWRALTAAELSSGKYYTREVIHYVGVPVNNVSVNKWRVDSYGLIGLHIIHKTVNFPAFTYATFEHVDNIASGIGYVDEINQTGRGAGDKFGAKVLVKHRDNPIPAPVAAVNATARAAIAGSVWANYQLTGIQAYPTDVSAARNAASANMTNKNDSSSFFLANIVIETNEELQNFTGKLAGNTKDDKNTWSGGKNLNMGGCMGCHGVAQSNGADFSFLIANAPFTAPEVVGATIGNFTPFQVKTYADVEKMFNEYIKDNPINIEGSPHKAFWNLGYQNFVTGNAYKGIKTVDCQTPSSKNSNLIAILKGIKPLPHSTAGFYPGQMPAGGPYFPKKQIDNLAAWIDAGCKENATMKQPKPAKCTQLNSHNKNGSLQSFKGVTCKQAQAVSAKSRACGGQNYQPFAVGGGLGNWETQDQCDGGQQPYQSQDNSKGFYWYACTRYPQDC